jgi:hypothetical protein
MQITVNIPDEVAEQARSSGVSVEDYVERLLSERLQSANLDQPNRRSKDEIAAWLNSLAAFSDRIPALPAAISRDWLYQDHD